MRTPCSWGSHSNQLISVTLLKYRQPNMKKRLLLTSVNQLIMLAKNNPAISARVPSLTPVQSMNMSATPQKSCNCGGKVNFTTPDVNKQHAENILSTLTQDDFNAIKSVLNLEELCYYKRKQNNTLEMVCL